MVESTDSSSTAPNGGGGGGGSCVIGVNGTSSHDGSCNGDNGKQASDGFAPPVPSSGSGFFVLRNLRVVLLFAGLGVSCLLVYGSVNPFAAFLPASSYPVDAVPKVNGTINNLDRILEEASMEDKTVILMALNDAWAEPGSIFDVFLKGFEIGNGTHKLLDHLVIIALDHKAYVRCLKIHPHCYALLTRGTDFSGEADFMSPDYLQMMWRRIDFLREILEKGYSFVFTDTDIVWLRDPFPRFYADADFQIACDHFGGNPFDRNNAPNGGFTYVKSNNRTIKFYKYWYRSREQYPGSHDQDVLNRIKMDPFIDDIGLRMKFLDTVYFGGFCEPSRDLNLVCTMHANCCVGLDNKIHDLEILLGNWRKYMKSLPHAKPSPSWSIPHDCSGSLGRPHQHHKQHS
ncbi:uncharacterized protein At4g15970-like [Syzygium oleosum]|uniref:uncharacterized protein At4g15970-like n=1 Tax=Syzygium oleosum TaxID=219896 RepID=UPI0011D1C171|nr:uncharacterized protein At4g15970-like [Syzygium oleosum]XP_056169369.1 uncharacterized protein At4g15970-like [Syzygium oleosum]XP_056169370.1 uncharacterized protein At4g15970-like [Syzygium oleosum]XP_056169372.1 uncharacterized protein At4g15970-like [Syzygium oleosum]